ncbi:MAG: tRNA (adenosine(37)-N6)-threonylcarbamoyltransferase complex ATPase subunit type 1 TsaE [Flavobacteriales bacterium]
MKTILELENYKLDDLPLIAEKLSAAIPDSGVVAFHGDMGVGKTTLIKQLCVSLGVVDRVSSPTFGLVNVYHRKNGTVINHIDLYRLENESEAEDAGIFDLFNNPGLSLVEWPERIANYLPLDSLIVKVSVSVNDGVRDGAECRNMILLCN